MQLSGLGDSCFCVEVKDTIEYRAQVWVDKIDLERYGGEASLKEFAADVS